VKSRYSRSNEKNRQGTSNIEFENQKDKKSENKFEYSKENIHNISFLCTLKIIQVLMKKIPKTMQILKSNGVKINFILSYGQVFQGYVGDSLKIEEIYSSPLISESENILKKFSEDYEEVSAFLDTSFSKNLSSKLQPLIFPCELLKTEYKGSFSKIQIIDKIHCTYSIPNKLEHDLKDVKITMNKEAILQERNQKLSNLSAYFGRLEEYIMSDKIIESYCHKDVFNYLQSEFIIFFDLLRKNQLNECIVCLRRIRKSDQYVHFNEPSFKRRLKKIEKEIKNKINHFNFRIKEENYTFSIKC
jgi:hypothetical protein